MKNVKRALARFSFAAKIFPVFAALLIFGCGGDMDELFCMTCDNYRMTYCLYNSGGSYSCEFMNVGKCNGTNYGKDNTCGGYGTAYIPAGSSSSSGDNSAGSGDNNSAGSGDSSSAGSGDSSSAGSGNGFLQCGSEWYNPETHFCQSPHDVVKPLCDGTAEFTSFQMCYDGDVVDSFCGINPQEGFDTYLYECKPGSNGIYLIGGLTDGDGKEYGAVLMGEKAWMAENLNYAVAGSKCGDESTKTLKDEDTETCDTYGRLYDWATAMALPSKCNYVRSTKDPDCTVKTPNHQGICPEGWHIPSVADWGALMKVANPLCSDNTCADAAAKLKATSGWNGSSNSTDEFGFSVLPGGYGYPGDGFSSAGIDGYWRTTIEYLDNYSNIWIMSYSSGTAYLFTTFGKNEFYSVRCLQD